MAVLFGFNIFLKSFFENDLPQSNYAWSICYRGIDTDIKRILDGDGASRND